MKNGKEARYNPPKEPWVQFVENTGDFDDKSQHLFLLTTSISADSDEWLGWIGAPEWTMVFDASLRPNRALFEACAQSSTVHYQTFGIMGHLTKLMERVRYWVFLDDMDPSEEEDYPMTFNSFIGSSFTPVYRVDKRSITLVVLWMNNNERESQLLSSTLGLFQLNFPKAKIEIVTPSPSWVTVKVPHIHHLSVREISEGFQRRFETPQHNEIRIASSGGPKCVGRNTLLRWKVCFDIPNFGNDEEPSLDDIKERMLSFLRGATPKWVNFQCGHDVSDRQFRIQGNEVRTRQQLQTRILELLQAKQRKCITVVHEPGAGGTTIARRILWNIRQSYPSFALQLSSILYGGEQLLKLLDEVFFFTNKTLLLLIDDDGRAPTNRVDKVTHQLLNLAIPLVILRVKRDMKEPLPPDTYYLQRKLSNSERFDFSTKYETLLNSTRHDNDDREAIVLEKKIKEEPTPILFGLYYFLGDSQRREIKDRIIKSLKSANDRDRRILQYCSLVWIYAHQTLQPSRFLATEDIRNKLSPSVQEFLIYDKHWRPVTNAVGELILSCENIPLSTVTVELVSLLCKPKSDPQLICTLLCSSSQQASTTSLLSQVKKNCGAEQVKIMCNEILSILIHDQETYWKIISTVHHSLAVLAIQSQEFQEARQHLSAIQSGNLSLNMQSQIHTTRLCSFRKEMECLLKPSSNLRKNFSLVLDHLQQSLNLFHLARSLNPKNTYPHMELVLVTVQFLSAFKDCYLKQSSIDERIKNGGKLHNNRNTNKLIMDSLELLKVVRFLLSTREFNSRLNKKTRSLLQRTEELSTPSLSFLSSLDLLWKEPTRNIPNKKLNQLEHFLLSDPQPVVFGVALEIYLQQKLRHPILASQVDSLADYVSKWRRVDPNLNLAKAYKFLFAFPFELSYFPNSSLHAHQREVSNNQDELYTSKKVILHVGMNNFIFHSSPQQSQLQTFTGMVYFHKSKYGTIYFKGWGIPFLWQEEGLVEKDLGSTVEFTLEFTTSGPFGRNVKVVQRSLAVTASRVDVFGEKVIGHISHFVDGEDTGQITTICDTVYEFEIEVAAPQIRDRLDIGTQVAFQKQRTKSGFVFVNSIELI